MWAPRGRPRCKANGSIRYRQGLSQPNCTEMIWLLRKWRVRRPAVFKRGASRPRQRLHPKSAGGESSASSEVTSHPQLLCLQNPAINSLTLELSIF